MDSHKNLISEEFHAMKAESAKQHIHMDESGCMTKHLH